MWFQIRKKCGIGKRFEGIMAALADPACDLQSIDREPIITHQGFA
jgi:hypothetical protein